MDMQNTSAGFRFKAKVVGKEGDTDLVNLIVEHLQFYKVEGFKYYWNAVYDETQNVIVDEAKDENGEPIHLCRFKKVRKPNFVPAKLTAKQKTKALAALREAGLIPAAE
jgi:hypothetical protein